MNLTIMDNAIDSLNRVVGYYAEGTPSGLKAAVKELVSCIELLVKEKIRRLDLDPSNPVLLFTQLKISPNNDRSGYVVAPISRTKTVTFDEAVERLEWLGEPIPNADQNMIRGLKKIRNAVEHLEVNANPEEIKRVFSVSLGITIKFVERNLGTTSDLTPQFLPA